MAETHGGWNYRDGFRDHPSVNADGEESPSALEFSEIDRYYTDIDDVCYLIDHGRNDDFRKPASDVGNDVANLP